MTMFFRADVISEGATLYPAFKKEIDGKPYKNV